MRTTVLDVRNPEQRAEAIPRAAEVLRRGGLVAFPTETVYGLGANALDADAVARIFLAKGRPGNNPLIVHLAGAEQVGEVAQTWPEAAARLAAAFWPGPLTLVLPRTTAVPDGVTGGGPTVGVRVPAHPVAGALLGAAGVPIAAPSANRSNRLSPTRAEHVLADLDGRIDLVLDGGPTPGGIESSVVDVTHQPPRLLRPGLVGIAAIEALIGPLGRQTSSLPDPAILPAPGMLARHYAPRTPLETIEGNPADRVRCLIADGVRVAVVSQHAMADCPEARVVLLPANPTDYAAVLYDTLHRLDDGQFDRIVVALPPDREEWLAIRDRLRRAGA